MKKRSLNFKLAVGSISAVILPLMVVGFFSVNKASNALLAAGEAQASHVAEDLAVMSNLYLESEIKFATSIANQDLITNTAILVHKEGIEKSLAELEAVDASLLRNYRKVGDNYENFIVANAEGLAIAGNAGANLRSSGLSLKERDYFKKSRNGETCISEPTKSLITGKPVIIISVPIKTKLGEFAGIFLTVLKLDALSEKITTVKLGETGYPFVVDKDGLTIVHPKKEFILELNLASLNGMEKIMSRMLNGEKGVDKYNFKGVDKIAGFVPISITGWSLGVTQNESEFMKAAVAIRNVILIVGFVFLVIAVVGVTFFARSIVIPITRISSGLNKGAEQVAAASTEVSKASQSLAEGSAEQAASIEESSSSMEEISSMTKNNAKNAQEADDLMMETNKAVSNANDSMEKLTQSMEEISKASKETSVIIKTIDEIAFQTNLLALNAAVEAARAGDAGAGFAVVADEVRNLAMRAAEAAKSTSERIEGTVSRVSDGAELVSVTSEALNSVEESSSKVAILVAEIAKASSEQSEGIGQVNTGINQMNTVVQQNAATAEESASASEEMSAQAEQLNSYVGELISLIMGDNDSKSALKNVAHKSYSSIPETPKPLYSSERRRGQSQLSSNKSNVVTAEDMIPYENYKELADF